MTNSLFILSPNLGCPEIVAPEDLNTAGIIVLAALPVGDRSEILSYSVQAQPSYPDQGARFELTLTGAEFAGDESLPGTFRDLSETRRGVSTALRRLLPGKTFLRVHARPSTEVGDGHMRTAAGRRLPTLYDLVLCRDGRELARARHCLCLRRRNPEVKFVHLTDLHVAARNDLWEREIPSIMHGEFRSGDEVFINFNARLRSFIEWANEKADRGELDFILTTGDLVDFIRTGLFDNEAGGNNWSTLIDILVGSGDEDGMGNGGLRVPMFTTPGNHDWRPNPYPPDIIVSAFGISKPCANELDYLYENTSAEVGRRIEEIRDHLVAKGSPILARSWWGSVVSFGLKAVVAGGARLSARLEAIAGRYFGLLYALIVAAFASGGLAALRDWAVWKRPTSVALIGLGVLILLAFASLLEGLLNQRLRKAIEGLIGIESDVNGLRDYFLEINPYFNYAFRLENCYFVVMDTGHDCLTADSFWDDGGKKISRVSVGDNILGGSPDTMGFYPPNEHYPYSQIGWLERVLDVAKRECGQQAGAPRKCRIFVGLHAPVANLSKAARRRADEQLSAGGGQPVVMKKGLVRGFNVGYGTTNHYLSEFYYLCLGCREEDRSKVDGPGIDAVFAGHAHWSIEFKLRRPQNASLSWNPEVLYGRFSQEVEKSGGPADRWWGPLLLQTGACGPPSETDPKTPNFRYVVVGADLSIRSLAPRTL